QAEVLGVLADEAAREDRRGKRAMVVALDGLEEALADLRGVGDLLERDPADLPLPPQLLAERRQFRVRRWLRLTVLVGHESGHSTPGGTPVGAHSVRPSGHAGARCAPLPEEALDAALEIRRGGRVAVDV